MTVYSAELVNAITNLIFTYLAIKGIRSCLKYGHDTIFLVTYAGYAVVGFGSFLFHSTLACKLAMPCASASSTHTTSRPNAAGRRAVHDLFNLFNGVRQLFALQIRPFSDRLGCFSSGSCHIHYTLLSLSSRSSISSERVCSPDGTRPVSEHVHHGKNLAA